MQGHSAGKRLHPGPKPGSGLRRPVSSPQSLGRSVRAHAPMDEGRPSCCLDAQGQGPGKSLENPFWKAQKKLWARRGHFMLGRTGNLRSGLGGLLWGFIIDLLGHPKKVICPLGTCIPPTTRHCSLRGCAPRKKGTLLTPDESPTCGPRGNHHTLSWGVSTLETGLPAPGIHSRLLLYTSARSIMGGGQGMPLGWWGVGGWMSHLPEPSADRGTGQLWPGGPTPCLLAMGSWTSCFPRVNKQELPLWPRTDKTQPGQRLHFSKAAHSPSLLEASLQCFEDLLHLLRLRVWAGRPLPQRAVHLGGFCRHSRPH